MPASDHLNPQLFHGTAHRFKKGEVILPANLANVPQNWGAASKNDPNLAHATSNLDSAKYFANVAKAIQGMRRQDDSLRARVYQVEPVNPQTAQWRDKKFAGGRGGSSAIREHVSSEGYRVVKNVWTERKSKP